MSQTTIMVSRMPRSVVRRLWLRTAHGLTACIADLVAAQRLSRERDQLSELSDATLMDLGLTRADIRAELRKPVWRR